MKQLLCRHLKPGDILLKMATGSLSHKFIQFGQRFRGQPNDFLAHAAIALDTQFAIEAQAVGVTANHLAMKNKDCGYIVYRCTNQSLGLGAAMAAKVLLDINLPPKPEYRHHERAHPRPMGRTQVKPDERKPSGMMKYDAWGAIKSVFGQSPPPKTAAEIDTLLDNVLQGRGHRFFCSQFVVFVYQFAALQSGLPAESVFPRADTKVSPSALASMLQGNRYFREAGYMMPNER